jgi:hypothetical protein
MLKIFLQKYKPTNPESPLEKIRDLVQASPWKNVLVQKLAGCKYVAYPWKDAHSKIPWYPKLLLQRENALASF